MSDLRLLSLPRRLRHTGELGRWHSSRHPAYPTNTMFRLQEDILQTFQDLEHDQQTQTPDLVAYWTSSRPSIHPLLKLGSTTPQPKKSKSFGESVGEIVSRSQTQWMHYATTFKHWHKPVVLIQRPRVVRKDQRSMQLACQRHGARASRTTSRHSALIKLPCQRPGITPTKESQSPSVYPSAYRVKSAVSTGITSDCCPDNTIRQPPSKQQQPEHPRIAVDGTNVPIISRSSCKVPVSSPAKAQMGFVALDMPPSIERAATSLPNRHLVLPPAEDIRTKFFKAATPSHRVGRGGSKTPSIFSTSGCFVLDHPAISWASVRLYPGEHNAVRIKYKDRLMLSPF
ncbi:uncharacterized protein ATNIH1004_002076 [Aspergillus tanneri]|uniref:Uncharacterized protein n=1 Tax=Aspergillus tanneri TaxID=1220188 RepID=A0A5M9M2S3_9EURO|nr:uncharacterized protein ATNIH1004_002076 [Aspergillus tanneri]KAA8641275.1 hypothetical protein ATNIH1004_002076 [Aspergillus tanneri]